MLAPSPDRSAAGRRARGLGGLLTAGVAFAATVAAGLYVVDLVRDFGATEIAAIELATVRDLGDE